MAGDRSPNYPIISLADALGRAQVVYEKERQHPADKLVIAKDLGYGSLNGLSRSIISALVKFGLLDEEQDRYKISMDALDLLLHSAGSPERVAAVQKVAFSPPLFAELRATFGLELPSDENLRAFLLKRGFNPHTVGNVIKSFRDTIVMVQQDLAASAAQQAQTAAAEAPVSLVKRPGSITMLPEPPQRKGTELAFMLLPTCHAKLEFTGEVTQAALIKLKAFLDLSLDAFPAPSAALGGPMSEEELTIWDAEALAL